jgi:hypothetical protein
MPHRRHFVTINPHPRVRNVSNYAFAAESLVTFGGIRRTISWLEQKVSCERLLHHVAGRETFGVLRSVTIDK